MYYYVSYGNCFMSNQTLDIINSRRSHRAYKADKISDEILNDILQAALASPSAMNLQPWHFSLVTDTNLINEINSAGCDYIKSSGDKTAIDRMEKRNWDIFYKAPAVIFISSDTTAKWHFLDAGIAVQNTALAAESLGLGSVIIGMIDCAFLTDKGPILEKKLQFPDGYKFSIAIALGYPDDDKPSHNIDQDKISIIK